MYRWSKIPEDIRPEIISNVSDESLYTLIVQNKIEKLSRKISILRFGHTDDDIVPRAKWAYIEYRQEYHKKGLEHTTFGAPDIAIAEIAFEDTYRYPVFKNIIDKNIPCALMHKVKNNWAPTIDTVVCFMTGNTLDVFLVHPKDLIEWDSNEEI